MSIPKVSNEEKNNVKTPFSKMAIQENVKYEIDLFNSPKVFSYPDNPPWQGPTCPW